MPIYEYRCRKCGEQFEAIRQVGDDGKDLACPECGAKGPEKLLSAFAVTGTCDRCSSAPT
jgi:putative FmdB family regulatory protein